LKDQEAERAAALRPCAARAAGLIARRIDDASQHAAAGKLSTAEQRLSELHGSLARHISDARPSFFRQAFRQHQPLDPAVHQTSLAPTAEAEAAARDARILGRSYDLDFRDLVEDARAALQSVALAKQSSGPDAPYLEQWAAEHGQRITARAQSELSNSQIAIFEAVGQILIKPEFRQGKQRLPARPAVPLPNRSQIDGCEDETEDLSHDRQHAIEAENRGRENGPDVPPDSC
jgi:hypothetical protein